MIYLGSPNMFQLRLGWLVRAAHLLSERPMDRHALGEALLHEATAPHGEHDLQHEWLSRAGLVQKPLGRISPRAADDIVRMCGVYGIYDAEAQALTDLGHILLIVDEQTKSSSPFRWDQAKRFIGLRLLMGADGDVVLSLLQRWPDTRQEVDASPIMIDALKQLALRAHADDTQALLSQSQRERSRELVYPRMEPLRELDYFQPGEAAGAYRLTASGTRLRKALSTTSDASRLLRAGLPQAFLRGEDRPLGAAASPHALLKTLRELPAPLRGVGNEASLEAVTLLTQCRLLLAEPGSWIDLQTSERLLADLGPPALGANRPQGRHVRTHAKRNLEG